MVLYFIQNTLPMLMVLLLLVAGCTKSPQDAGPEDWPTPMAELLADYPEISGSITTVRHDLFINHKYTWKIIGQKNEIDRLIEDLKLQPTTKAHAKFEELRQSIPGSWELPNSSGAAIYVSEGFGTQHQEGTHLVLLVRNLIEDETIVLYEWIF